LITSRVLVRQEVQQLRNQLSSAEQHLRHMASQSTGDQAASEQTVRTPFPRICNLRVVHVVCIFRILLGISQ
jgi:hypothetical protein